MATFDTADAYFPNLYLNLGEANDDIQVHGNKCLCRRCRDHKYSTLKDQFPTQTAEERRQNIENLREMVTVTIPKRISQANLNVFEEVREQIIYGTLYKDYCLNGSGFVQYKSWAKTVPFYRQFANGTNEEQKRFRIHCQLINDCAIVFDNWELIVKNLQNTKIVTDLDSSNFSVNQYWRAMKPAWVIMENERVRFKSRKSDLPPEEKLWSTDDINNMATTILGVNRLSEATPRQIASFCQQVEHMCVSRVLQKNANQELLN